jgi:hypothetical protein
MDKEARKAFEAAKAEEEALLKAMPRNETNEQTLKSAVSW